MAMDLTELGRQAREAAAVLNSLGSEDKNRGLREAAGTSGRTEYDSCSK